MWCVIGNHGLGWKSKLFSIEKIMKNVKNGCFGIMTSMGSYNIVLSPSARSSTSTWFMLGATFFPLNFQCKSRAPKTRVNLYTIWTWSDIVVQRMPCWEVARVEEIASQSSTAGCVFYVEISRKLSGINVAKIFRDIF